jgi:hypothetical protein
MLINMNFINKNKYYIFIGFCILVSVSYVLLNFYKENVKLNDEQKVGASSWLSGYTYRQLVNVSSGAVAPGTNYVPSIRISNKVNPIASSTWIVNGKTYNYRLPITIKENTGQALTNQKVRAYIDTAWLKANGYVDGSSSGNTVEFTGSSSSQVLTYYFATSLYNSKTSQYFFYIDIGAYQSTTTYMYFDPDNTGVSTNWVDPATVGYYYNDTNWSATTSSFNIRWIDDNSNNNAYRDSWVWFGGPTNGMAVNYTYGGTTYTATITPKTIYDLANYSAYGCSTSTTSVVQAGDASTVNLGNYERFYGTGIPGGATINSAKMYYWPFSNLSGTTVRTNLQVENSTSTANFASTTCALIAARSYSSVVAWDSIPAWTTGNYYYSNDIKSILQPLVGSLVFQNTFYATSSLYNMPIVNVPSLFTADVYLDGLAQDWPYDVVFTTSDGVSQLNFTTERETEYSDAQDFIMFHPKAVGSFEANSVYQVYIYYGKNTNLTYSSYLSDNQVYALSEHFDATSTNSWLTSGGSWSISPQQMAANKAGVYRNTRNPVLVQKNGLWYQFYINTNSIAPGILFTTSAMTTKDFRHWNLLGDVFNDYSTANVNASVYSNPSEYFGNIATSTDGTYWAGLTVCSYSPGLGLASSSDLINWRKCTATTSLSLVDTTAKCGTTTKPFDWSIAYDQPNNMWYAFATNCHLVGSTSVGMVVATSTGANPCADTWKAQGYVPYFTDLPNLVYQENYDIKKINSTWYLFYSGDYLLAAPQKIGIATSSNLANMSGWKNNGYINKPRYSFEESLQGTGKFWIGDDGLYYMTYTAEPYFYYIYNIGDAFSPLILVDNYVGLATTTAARFAASSTDWDATNMDNMLYQSASTTNLLSRATTTTVYGNISMVTDMMTRWTSNNQRIGVTWRENAGDFYAANFVPGNGSYNGDLQVWKVIGGSWGLMSSTTLNFPYWVGSEIHRIRVQSYNGYDIVGYSAYGESWTTVFASTTSYLANTGNIGVFTYGIQGYFNNLFISPFVYPDVSFGGQGVEIPAARQPILGAGRIRLRGKNFIIK